MATNDTQVVGQEAKADPARWGVMTVALGGNRRNALATVDQDVEQQSVRLIRQTISAHGVLAEHVTGTVRVVIQYTKYGERGRVVLPPVCRRG
jgi:hypothetical protein